MAVTAETPRRSGISRGERPWGKAAPVAKRWRHRAAGALYTARSRAVGARTALLTVSGFGWLSASVWEVWGTGAGFGAIGVSCLVIECLSGERGKG